MRKPADVTRLAGARRPDNLGAAACACAGEQGGCRRPCSAWPNRTRLTGIANRQGFQTLLAGRLAEHQGRGLALGLRSDNFSHVSGALGYQAGDRLILVVAASRPAGAR